MKPATGLAAIAFTRVERQGMTGGISIDDLAGAVTGLGKQVMPSVGVLGQNRYRPAVTSVEYLNLANRGRVELYPMREALSGLKRTGLHVPGYRERAYHAVRVRIGTSGTGPNGLGARCHLKPMRQAR